MQTPKFSRTYTTLRWICIFLFAINVVLALIVLVPLFVERVDQWSGWQSGEWAAAGAWIGGIATSCAVIVALSQTREAKRQAYNSREDAERLLTTELDAQRRDNQINAVLPILAAMTQFLDHSTDLVDAIVAAGHKGASADKKEIMEEKYKVWSSAKDQTYNSFFLANLIVAEPITRSSASEAQKQYVAIRDITQKSYEMINRSNVVPNNTKSHIGKMIGKGYTSRMNLLKATREHISQVPTIGTALEEVQEG